jgi:DNA-binding NtrC family response regulator
MTLVSRQLATVTQLPLHDPPCANGLVGSSAPMCDVARQIRRAAGSDIPVCISGESGTGKELVARAIHEGSSRRRGPFVAVNCAAIPDSLHEAELFGHERGAFTGAVQTHKGRFEQANGGTLFLDELGEMSPSTQASLLRTLQEKTIRRVGGTVEIPIDFRIVCATHRNLKKEVAERRFREDLYFRLFVYPIDLVPLRERADDIPALVEHFLERLGGASASVSPEAMVALRQYTFPGNVRELQNIVHRSLVSTDGARIELSDLPREVRRLSMISDLRKPSIPVPPAREPGLLSLRELESRAIRGALEASGGSVGKAAKMLGIGRATLYRRLAEEAQPRDAAARPAPVERRFAVQPAPRDVGMLPPPSAPPARVVDDAADAAAPGALR